MLRQPKLRCPAVSNNLKTLANDQNASPTPMLQVQLSFPRAKSARRLTWYFLLSAYLGPPPMLGRTLFARKISFPPGITSPRPPNAASPNPLGSDSRYSP